MRLLLCTRAETRDGVVLGLKRELAEVSDHLSEARITAMAERRSKKLMAEAHATTATTYVIRERQMRRLRMMAMVAARWVTRPTATNAEALAGLWANVSNRILFDWTFSPAFVLDEAQVVDSWAQWANECLYLTRHEADNVRVEDLP